MSSTMMLDKAKTKHLRKDSWVKDLLKSYAPEYLASLIQKRIEKPNIVGPYIATLMEPKEEPTDIIWALIEVEGNEFRAKMEPAIGLLLFKMLHDELKETPELLSGLFNVIYESRLMGCRKLVYNWLQAKLPVLVDPKHPLKSAYRDGLFAFARIQNSDPEIELFWHNLWRKGRSYYHSVAFTGLRVQNPKAAADELQLFAARNMDNKALILSGMWKEFTSRQPLEIAIKRGLIANQGWSGKLFNSLLATMSEENKEEMLVDMSQLRVV